MDQQQDAGWQVLYGLSQRMDLPAYVKQAAACDTMQPRGLPDRAYADPRKRRFPCHTKAATFLSWMYFLEHRDQLDAKEAESIQNRLLHFSHYWKISSDVARALEKTASQYRYDASQEPDDVFGVVLPAGERRYPLRNRDEVQAAAKWFLKHADSIRHEWPYPLRASLAERILKRAEDLGESLDDAQVPLERCAGLGIASIPKLAEQVRWRSYAPCAPKGPLRKLADQLSPEMSTDRQELTRVAEMLDSVDKHCGLRYGGQLLSPEEACFQVTRSEIEDTQKRAWQLPTGSVWPEEILSELAGADLRSVVGWTATPELMPSPDSIRESLQQLTIKAAMRVERWLESQGYQPLREAPRVTPMTKQDWKAWARLA